ncbi:MAG: hypothetical protein JW727_03650 [Candidatus Aenigmarchaeota archaeon]|nr:hypothetical protein [Candidatus Aenigmarchaeota archaeon]
MNKKWLLLIAVVALGLLAVSAKAYSDGKDVTSEPYIMFVSHTEYWSGDNASTIVRLTDYKGDPYDVDICIANIFYPNKTAYVSNQPLQPSSIPGNWYRTDPAPLAEGTYEQEVTCTYGGSKTTKASQSFHVNPALNLIRNLSEQNIALDLNLGEINLTLTGTIENTTAGLSGQINSTETTLSGLIRDINETLAQDIASSNAEVDTRLIDMEISLKGKIAENGQQIVSNLSVVEGNLTALIEQVNSDLQSQLSANGASIDSGLLDVQVNVTGTVENAKTQIILEVQDTETTITSAIGQLDTDLSGELSKVNASIDSKLTDVSIGISAQVAGSRDAIQAQLTGVNGSISDLVNATQSTMLSYMGGYLPYMNQTLEGIRQDTEWLVSNAMGGGNMTEINQRFDSVDADLASLQAMCGDEITNDSQLCRDVFSLKETVQSLKSEQTAYLEDINATTASTWQLLSGDFAAKLDSILLDLGLIKAQTSEINQTLSQMRDDQLNQVNIHIIS